MVYFKGISGRKNILKCVCPVKTLVQTGLAFVFLVYRTFPSILCGIMYMLLFVHHGVRAFHFSLKGQSFYCGIKLCVHVYIHLYFKYLLYK